MLLIFSSDLRVLRVLNGADQVAVVAQELDLVARTVRDGRQFAEARVLGGYGRSSAALPEARVLRGDVPSSVPVEDINLAVGRIRNVELARYNRPAGSAAAPECGANPKWTTVVRGTL